MLKTGRKILLCAILCAMLMVFFIDNALSQVTLTKANGGTPNNIPTGIVLPPSTIVSADVDTLPTVASIGSYADTAKVLLITDPSEGGVFRLTSSLVDGNTKLAHKNANGKQYLRDIEENGVNLAMFGLTPTGGGDVSAAITAALAALPDYRTGTNGSATVLRLPSGNFTMSSPITFTRSVHLVGQGEGNKSNSTINYTGGGDFAFFLSAPSSTPATDIGASTFENFRIIGQDVGKAFRVESRATIKGVYISDFEYGVYVYASIADGKGNANNSYFELLDVWNCTEAGYFVKGSDSNAHTFIGCTAFQNNEGFVDSSFLANTYYSCLAEGNTLSGFRFQGNARPVRAIGCYAEGGDSLKINAPSGWLYGTVNDYAAQWVGDGIYVTANSSGIINKNTSSVFENNMLTMAIGGKTGNAAGFRMLNNTDTGLGLTWGVRTTTSNNYWLRHNNSDSKGIFVFFGANNGRTANRTTAIPAGNVAAVQGMYIGDGLFNLSRASKISASTDTTNIISPANGDRMFNSNPSGLGGVSTFYYRNNRWESLLNGLVDTDGDTKVQVEESKDEDIIRFDVAGVEKATIVADGLTVTGNNAGVSDEVISLYHNSASPNDDDYISVPFYANDSGANKTKFSEIRATVDNVADGSEFGGFEVYVANNGTLEKKLDISATVVATQTDMTVNGTTYSNGGVRHKTVTVAPAGSPGTYAVLDTDYHIGGNTAFNDVTITLPASPTSGRTLMISKESTANTLNIDGNGNAINGASPLVLTAQYESVVLIYNGSQWRRF